MSTLVDEKNFWVTWDRSPVSIFDGATFVREQEGSARGLTGYRVDEWFNLGGWVGGELGSVSGAEWLPLVRAETAVKSSCWVPVKKHIPNGVEVTTWRSGRLVVI